MNHTSYEQQLASHNAKSKKVVEFNKIVADLWYDQSIELVFFRNQLVDRSVSDIINLHEYAEEFLGKAIEVDHTLTLAKTIVEANLPASRLDIGKLAAEYQAELADFNSPAQFIETKLAEGKDFKNVEPKDVVLYGFGRIGRLLAVS